MYATGPRASKHRDKTGMTKPISLAVHVIAARKLKKMKKKKNQNTSMIPRFKAKLQTVKLSTVTYEAVK